MVRRPVQQPKQAAAIPKEWPAPRDGWIANLNLAQPGAKKADGTALAGAKVLDNFFPTATGVLLLRGSELYATLGQGDLPVDALFSYNAGTVERMFGATENTIYDITTISQASNQLLGTENDDVIGTENDDEIGWLSTEDLDVMTGLTGGDWSVSQFATAGGIYLVGNNGEDPGFLYDGTAFYPQVDGGASTLAFDTETGAFTEGLVVTGGTSGATATIYRVSSDGSAGTLVLTNVTGDFTDDEAITDSATGAAIADGTDILVPGTDTSFAEPGLTTADLSNNWVYQTRMWFAQKDSLDVWYLPVDQVSGELTKLPLAGVFGLGGSILFGASWSLDSGNQGGLSEQMIVVTTEGEVAVFQGSNPADANNWSKVGVYRIGRPRGKKAWVRDGGDLIIATSIGYVRLSEAIRRELAALGPTAVSYPIETAWNEAVDRRPNPWHCEIWSSKQMAVVAIPTQGEEAPAMFLANVRTGAWCRRPNWDATCTLVFKERLFFGSQSGKVVEANVTGLDEGQPYTGIVVPLFDSMGAPASLKISEMIMAFGMSPTPVNVQTSMQVDFAVDLPPAPDALPVPVGNEWGNAIWGTSVWGSQPALQPRRQWDAVAGEGYALSPAVQITSGAIVPLDYELVSTQTTHRVAKVIS